MTDQGPAEWRTSSYSSGGGQCVEVAIRPARVSIRDTKDRKGGLLDVPATAWAEFTQRLGQN